MRLSIDKSLIAERFKRRMVATPWDSSWGSVQVKPRVALESVEGDTCKQVFR